MNRVPDGVEDVAGMRGDPLWRTSTGVPDMRGQESVTSSDRMNHGAGHLPVFLIEHHGSIRERSCKYVWARALVTLRSFAPAPCIRRQPYPGHHSGAPFTLVGRQRSRGGPGGVAAGRDVGVGPATG